MDDDLFLINDIEKEYKKLSTETKKKYPKLKELVDFSLKTIDKIKSAMISPNTSLSISQVKKQFESELQLSMNIIIKPINIISNVFVFSVPLYPKLLTGPYPFPVTYEYDVPPIFTDETVIFEESAASFPVSFNTFR